MFTVLLAFNFEFGRVRQAVAGRSSGRARLEMEGATRRRRGRRRVDVAARAARRTLAAVAPAHRPERIRSRTVTP
jgi:hypothetical protein